MGPDSVRSARPGAWRGARAETSERRAGDPLCVSCGRRGGVTRVKFVSPAPADVERGAHSIDVTLYGIVYDDSLRPVACPPRAPPSTGDCIGRGCVIGFFWMVGSNVVLSGTAFGIFRRSNPASSSGSGSGSGEANRHRGVGAFLLGLSTAAWAVWSAAAKGSTSETVDWPSSSRLICAAWNGSHRKDELWSV